MTGYTIYIVIGVIVLLVVLTIVGILSRYKKVKSDEILVVYGKTKGNQAAKCLHGGAAFVWPVFQGWAVMSTKPMTLQCNLQGAISLQKIKVSVNTTITAAISTEAAVMANSAVRLLSMDERDIENQIRDVAYGQLRLIIADMTIEELVNNREKFLNSCKTNIEEELKKFGLTLLNINISEISDEANYLENLSRDETAKAKYEAEASITKREKDGATQVATQQKEKDIQLSEIERDKQIKVAENQAAQATKTAEIQKEKNTQVAEQKKEETVKIREIEKERSVQTSEQEQLEATRLAEIAKEREVQIATNASQQAQQVAEQEKLRDIAVAQKQADAASQAAQAKNKSQAEIAEAEKQKEARVIAAGHNAEAEKQKAQQEREAREAEYLSSKRQRAADADKSAKVAENKAGVEVAKSDAILGKEQAEAAKTIGEAKAKSEQAVGIAQAEKDKEVALARAEAKRAELEAELISGAEKEAERKQVEAEGIKNKTIIEAEGEAERILRIAKAEAERIRLTKLAEAEGMRAMAEVKKIENQAETENIANLARAGLSDAAAISFILRDKYEGIIRGEQAKFDHLQLGEVKVIGDASQASKFLTQVVDGVQKSSVLGDLIPGLAGLLAKGTKFDQKQQADLNPSAPVTPAPDYQKPDYQKPGYASKGDQKPEVKPTDKPSK